MGAVLERNFAIPGAAFADPSAGSAMSSLRLISRKRFPSASPLWVLLSTPTGLPLADELTAINVAGLLVSVLNGQSPGRPTGNEGPHT